MSEEPNVSGEQNQEAAVPPIVESNQVQTEQPESNDVQNEQNVPLSALQSERTKRQQMEDELRMMKEHMNLLQANQMQAKEKPKDDLDNLDDGDVLTVGEAKKFINKMNTQYQMSIEELKMTQKHPDYQEVISKYLPEVLKQNPGLQNSLQKTQDYELAYYLAKNSDNYRREKKRSTKSADAQRIVENSQKAGSLSSMGSTSPISQAKRYKDMSDSDFRNLVSKNLGGP
jgi:hypothetical protein